MKKLKFCLKIASHLHEIRAEIGELKSIIILTSSPGAMSTVIHVVYQIIIVGTPALTLQVMCISSKQSKVMNNSNKLL